MKDMMLKEKKQNSTIQDARQAKIFSKFKDMIEKGERKLKIGIAGTAVLFSLAFPSFNTDSSLYAQTYKERQPNEHLLGYRRIKYPFEV
ncbi:MAG: hypothetical protein N3G80_00005, partial [Candidatus Micrarchaeota archaeon]|nr:hypothetical protein [Candidatus Micrarchaeota archaeon]